MYAGVLAGGGEPKSPGEVKYAVATTQTAAALVDKLLEHVAHHPQDSLLAVDIETSGFGPRMDRILCVGVTWQKNKAVIFPASTVPCLKRLFEDPRPRFCWHNGKFDCSFLHSVGINARVDEDCMLLSYALDEQQGTHGLKDLASDYLGAPDYKQIVLQYAPHKADSFENIPRPLLYKYLAQDCDNTYQLYYILRDKVNRDEGLRWLYEHLLIPASNFLQRVEAHGIALDQERLSSLRDKLMDDLEHSLDQTTVAAGEEFNPNSPLQVRTQLARQGVKVESTQEKFLLPYIQVPVVRAVLDYRGYAKMIGTYCDGMLQRMEPDGRVHPTFLIHGTENGRLSSKNPSGQNIPRVTDPQRNVKANFYAPPGNLLLEADYSQAELRCLAWLSGDRFLTQCFVEGRNFHNEMSLQIFGPNYTYEQRETSKFVTFGMIYGRTAKPIAEELHISIREAQELIDRWFARCPDAKRYLEECKNAVTQHGVLQSRFGRKRRFNLVTSEGLHHMQNEAMNFPLASHASDFDLITGITVQPYLEEHGASIINLVHDSLVIEVPQAYAQEVADYVATTMESVPYTTLGCEVPFVAECKVGTHWGELSPLQTTHYIREELPTLASWQESVV